MGQPNPWTTLGPGRMSYGQGRLGESYLPGRLGNLVVSLLDSGAVGPGFKSQTRRCRVTVLGRLFTPIVPLFTKQQNW